MLGGAGAGVNARGICDRLVPFFRGALDGNPGEAAFMWLSFGSNKVHVVLILGIFVFCGFHIYWLAGFGFFLA